MHKQEWFERWFGDEYKALYPHRDETQAHEQVGALIQSLSASPSWRVLDVGCGSGRHLQSFQHRGFQHAFGIDLSSVLLQDARTANVSVARADMRHLPFAEGSFDLLTSFFTSFGYFATPDEDLYVLREFCRTLKPDGCIFLDLPNPPLVIQGLVAHDTQKIGNDTIQVDRFLEGDQVVKRIRCGNGGDMYEERVRLYSLSALQPGLDRLKLSLLRIFGDERGAEFAPQTSPRMGLLLRRN